MATDIKTELRIPDLWFDFYARLLPGAVFVAACYIFLLDMKIVPSGIEVLLLIFAGYIASMITQPIAGEIVKRLYKFVEKQPGSVSVRQVLSRLGSPSKEYTIIEKMHGEVNFYIQSACLAFGFMCLAVAPFRNSWDISYLWTVAVVIGFLGLGAMHAFRRMKRAEEAERWFVQK